MSVDIQNNWDYLVQIVGNMDVPYSEEISEDKIVRTFDISVDDMELVWHRDLYDRVVNIIQSGGWKYQTENELPLELKNGDIIHIPKMSWHRILKGTENLIVEIYEKKE